MAETNLLPCSSPFTRGSKVRASLPVSRTSCPTGVLYLQYGDETKQVRMPGEISSVDTLRAMFVTAFPQLLTMKVLRSPNTAIYMKDPSRNVYFDLDDIRNITPHSCLKLYHRDAAQLLSLVHSESRISKEVLYGNHSPVHRSSPSSRVSLHSLQGSMSPPMVRSMPSSPSRIAYGGRGTQARVQPVDAVNATISRERLFTSRRSSSLCSSSSAILERRDVKPDDDVGSSKSTATVVRAKRGAHYSDSLCFPQHDDGGSIDISSSRCSAPPSMSTDLLDTGIPVGLRQYRATVKPLLGFGDTLEQQTRSLNSSLRQSSNVAMVEVMSGSRRHGSTSSTSSVFMDSPVSQFADSHMTQINMQSERMKAMEEQIAGLAGLVHHALSAGVDISEIKDLTSDIAGNCQLGLLAEDAYSSTVSAPPSLLPPPLCMEMQQNLASATRNMSELRLQLTELRCLQLSNYQAVSSMLRMVGQELVLIMCDRLAQSEEAMHSRRAKMEEERIHYQAAEERILRKLRELEKYVEHLHTNTSNPGQQSITLRDVEEAAINLRRVGEELAIIKGEFPELQMKMRSVLRPELEAVRFLKEEPLKMDSMLKRVKVLTETLSLLRRCVTELSPLPRPVHMDKGQEPKMKQSPDNSPKPQPRSSVRTNCLSRADQSASQIITRRMKIPAASGASPPLTPSHGHDLTQVAKAEREAPDGSQNGDTSHVDKTPHIFETQTHHDLCSSNTRGQMDKSVSKSGQETPLDVTVQVSQHSQSQQQNVEDAKTLSVSPSSSASTSFDHRSRHAVEKPIHSSVDEELKQSPAGGCKSPAPPPPPRRSKASRNEEKPEEVILTIRKEPVGKQEEKRKPVAAQPKPPRHPPEVKPKPQRYPRALLDTPPPVTAQNHSEDKKMKTDQQVTNEPLKHFPGKNDQLKQQDEGSPPPQLTYCVLTEPVKVTSDQTVVVNKSHDYGHPTVGDQKPEVKKKLTEEKPHLIVILNLEKDNTKNSTRNDQDKSVSPDPDFASSHPSSSFHSEGKIQDNLSHLSINTVQSPDEIGSFSADTNGCFSTTRAKLENKAQDKEYDIIKQPTYLAYENPGFELNDDKAPIIVVLEEPVDVQLENKRLSIIFECEEEDNVKEEKKRQIVKGLKDFTGTDQSHESPVDNQDWSILNSLPKPKPKQKFKFKFAQNKLAAISQAFRLSTKPGKKTAEVVYDKEEKTDSKKDGKEYKTSSTDDRKGFENRSGRVPTATDVHQSPRQKCVNEICESTHESIDSLEESIKQLAISVDSIAIPLCSPNSISHCRDKTFIKGNIKQDRDRSLSKRPAPPVIKGQTPPESKRAKPQPAQKSRKSSEKKQTLGGIASSSTHLPNIMSQQSSSSGPLQTPISSKQPVIPKQLGQTHLVTIPQ